ncbi:MAG: TolC family protein, partial [Muribaculaceae bacterium]|nr:TolC family protein [Muribaculaceae bacterium]
PALSAAVHSSKADELALKAENQLEAPEIEVEHLFAGKGQKDKTGVTVSQSFDWPGAYMARSRAIDASSEASRLRIASLRREKLLEAKLLMIDIIYTRRQLAVLDSVSANISRQLAYTEDGFRRGELTILDVNRMRIERLAIQTKISAAAMRQVSLRSSLEIMAGSTDITDIWDRLDNFPSAPLATEDTYAAAAEENNPMIVSARAAAAAAKAEATAARMNS